MRALIQRVSEASVSVDGKITGEIGRGLCVFVGFKNDDTADDTQKLAQKITQLRIFPDSDGKMNVSLRDQGGALLIVSQFTLYGDAGRGNRPSYSKAAKAEWAYELYEKFVAACRELCSKVETGVFQAHMQVRIVNDGPVTLMCFSGE